MCPIFWFARECPNNLLVVTQCQTKKREQCCIYVLLPHILRVVSIETNELLLDLLFENLMVLILKGYS